MIDPIGLSAEDYNGFNSTNANRDFDEAEGKDKRFGCRNYFNNQGNGKKMPNDLSFSKKGKAMLMGYEHVPKEGIKDGKYVPYPDYAGKMTIAHGHLIKKSENFDTGISFEEGDALWSKDLTQFETEVRDAIKVPLTQYEYDALVIFNYNTGAISGSTVATRINDGNYSRSDLEYSFHEHDWVKDAKTGQSTRANAPRRQDEVNLFLQNIYKLNNGSE